MVEIPIRGRLMQALARELERAGGTLEYPAGRHQRTRQRAVVRLEAAGLVQVNEARTLFHMKPGTKPLYVRDLLERLREGPLSGSDWRQVATSPGCLRVKVHQLRERSGWNIEARPVENQLRKPGRARVEYVLQGRAKA